MVDKEITQDNPYKLCFVCLGNICRSPTAEGVFQHLVNERNRKSQKTANQHGITLHSKARQLESFDLDYFDLVLAMDKENLTNIKRMSNGNPENVTIGMLRDFDPEPGDGEVPDPYYGGIQGFENVFQIVKRSCVNLLDRLESNIKE